MFFRRSQTLEPPTTEIAAKPNLKFVFPTVTTSDEPNTEFPSYLLRQWQKVKAECLENPQECAKKFNLG